MQTCLHPGHAKGLLLRQQLCSVLPGRRRAGCLLAPLLISLLALCTAQPWQISVANPPMPLPLLPHVRQACHRRLPLSRGAGNIAGTSPVGDEVSAARAELPLWVRLDACGHHGPLSSS